MIRVPGRADPLSQFRGHCTSCHVEILWAVSASSGVHIPLNPKPSQMDGNIITYIDTAGPAPILIAGVLTRPQRTGAVADGKRLYTSHFVSCPNANRHRRRSRRP